MKNDGTGLALIILIIIILIVVFNPGPTAHILNTLNSVHP